MKPTYILSHLPDCFLQITENLTDYGYICKIGDGSQGDSDSCLLPCISIYTLCFLRFFSWGNIGLSHHMLHVYTVIFLLLYTWLRDHHQKFSFHPSPFSWSLWPISPPPCLFLSLLCVCMFGLVYSLFLFFVCVLYSTVEWSNVVCVIFHLTYFLQHNTL